MLNRETLRASLATDRALASSLVFGHRHPQDTPAFHLQIIEAWRSANEFVVVEAFREAAKSTLSEEFIILEAVFGNFRYGLIFGETWTKACQRLSAVKHELLTNEKLKAIFGLQKGPVWSDDTIVLANGVRIEAHGWEEEIRGYKWLDARPDRAYLDDIENASMVRDTAAVDATWRKLNTQLIPALDTLKRKVRVTGTPLSDDCLMNRCRASPEWVVASFPVCVSSSGSVGAAAVDEPDARSMWPDRYPMGWIRKEKSRFESSGLLREFVQEYMLISAATQGKPFLESEIVFEDMQPAGYWPRKLIVDPARTTNQKKSDRTGRVVVSRIGTTIYVHESSGEYWKPDEVVADLFETSARHEDCAAAIERNSLDEWLMQPIRAEMLRRGRTLDIEPLLAPPDRSKEQFILGLQPFFKAGDIVFLGPRSKHRALVAEVVNFPTGKRDILNALAYAQRVFGGEAVYPGFTQANIVQQWEVAGQGRDSQADTLALGLHATASEICGVLVAVSGQRKIVLADWASSLTPLDAIRDMLRLIRATWPTRRCTVWVPADVYDQQGRVGLMEAVHMLRLEAYRGGYIAQSRGALTDGLRTELAGKRLVLVDRQATGTLSALAGGYRYRIGQDGRAAGEPEKNVSKTLMEALEQMVWALDQQELMQHLPAGFGSARNAQGVEYFSALKR